MVVAGDLEAVEVSLLMASLGYGTALGMRCM